MFAVVINSLETQDGKINNDIKQMEDTLWGHKVSGRGKRQKSNLRFQLPIQTACFNNLPFVFLLEGAMVA